MATIYYNTLNRDFKKALKNKTFSNEDLRKVFEKIKTENNKKKKTINIVMIALLVLMVIMMFPTIINSNNPDMTKFMIKFMIPIYILIYAIVYITQIGILKLQFNQAIKKNYPDLADEIKL